MAGGLSNVLFSIALISMLGLGCVETLGPPSEPANPEELKAEIAASYDDGKADQAYDVCAEYGWYGDGECDTFCPNADPDCTPSQPSPEPPSQPSCQSYTDCAENEFCWQGRCVIDLCDDEVDCSPTGVCYGGECCYPGQDCDAPPNWEG